METMFIILKVFLYSIVGYYVIGLLEKKNNLFSSFYSPFYALFSLIAISNTSCNIIWNAFSGIMWSWTLKLFLATIDDSLVPRISSIWFSLLNLLNLYVFDQLFDKLIYNSSTMSISILLGLGLIATIADFSLKMRKSL